MTTALVVLAVVLAIPCYPTAAQTTKLIGSQKFASKVGHLSDKAKISALCGDAALRLQKHLQQKTGGARSRIELDRNDRDRKVGRVGG